MVYQQQVVALVHKKETFPPTILTRKCTSNATQSLLYSSQYHHDTGHKISTHHDNWKSAVAWVAPLWFCGTRTSVNAVLFCGTTNVIVSLLPVAPVSNE